MHLEVIRAMQATWHAVSNPELKRYANSHNTNGWVRETGAFSLVCFGNACDLSVYPSTQLADECKNVELGCHNLDSAEQQLTLLAGLAKICELARESS